LAGVLDPASNPHLRRRDFSSNTQKSVSDWEEGEEKLE